MPHGPEAYRGGEKRLTPTHETFKPERGHEFKPNPEAEVHNIEQARKMALKEVSESAQHKQEVTPEETAASPLNLKNSKVARKLSFNKTMSRVQKQMPLHQEVFSKVVHMLAVEKTTEFVASTIARPNAILSGSIGAFLITGTLYMAARYYGFSLSGSETIIAFAAGWVLGTLIDLLRMTILRKN